jgi:hypothetical protein
LIQAMAKDPRDRFESYDAFSMALQAARSELLVNQLNQPAPGSKKSWWR